MRVYRSGEINELHEIPLYFTPYECPHCIGGAEHIDAPHLGIDEWVECSECGGTGTIYLKDSRPCKFCNQKIHFERHGDKWLPFNPDDTKHYCPRY